MAPVASGQSGRVIRVPVASGRVAMAMAAAVAAFTFVGHHTLRYMGQRWRGRSEAPWPSEALRRVSPVSPLDEPEPEPDHP